LLDSLPYLKGNGMTQDIFIKDRKFIRDTILSYLIEHPDACDTLEGILQWWLLNQTITYQIARVQEVLGELVAGGYLVQNKENNVRLSYQINKQRLNEISAVLKQMPAEDGFRC
jgi:hypothetical protein